MSKRTFILLCSAAVLFMTAATPTFAVTEYAQPGTVLRIATLGGTGGKVVFGVSQIPAHTCTAYSSQEFVLDTSTPDGKAAYAVLLLAKATGKPIDVWYEDSTAPGTNETDGCGWTTMSVVDAVGLDPDTFGSH
jgi:hypothetical protein